MKKYIVKYVSHSKLCKLAEFTKLSDAEEYAVNWSNENNKSALIYSSLNSSRAIRFTHKMSDNNYILFR